MEKIRDILNLLHLDELKNIENLPEVVTGWMQKASFVLALAALLIVSLICLAVILSDVIKAIGRLEKVNLTEKARTRYTFLLSVLPVAEVVVSVWAVFALAHLYSMHLIHV